MKLKILMLVILLIFVFPQKVKADSREVVVRFNYDSSGVMRTVYDEIKFVGNFSDEERAVVLFENLFSAPERQFVPEGTKVLGISIIDSVMYLNVSCDIMNYGGVYYEKHLRAQIVRTGLQMSAVDKITLSIEGDFGILPEGMTIDKVGEWENLLD